jgi:ATP-binding cassette subfamily B (MDR/TAP) protein 1
MEKAPMPLPGTVPVPAPVPVDENPTVLDEKTLEDGDGSSAAGLTEDEKSIIRRQLDAPNESVGYFALFRYANKQDMLIMFVSFLASVVAGACLPLMTLVYGNFAGSFTSFSVDALAAERFQHQINTFTLYFVYLGKSYLHRISR